MQLKNEKLVRFNNDGKKIYVEPLWEKHHDMEEKPLAVYKIQTTLNPECKIGGTGGGDRNRINIIRFPTLGKFKVFLENHVPYWKKRIIIDPGSDVFLRWNRVFLFSCILSLFIDPLFFYLHKVVAIANDDGNSSSCMATDLKLVTIVALFRTIADAFYVLNMAIKFRTAYVSPSSRVFGKGELVMDPELIARRYVISEFFLDYILALPLPQIVIWLIKPAIRSPHADHTNNALVLVVLLQYVPKLYLIFPLSSQIIKATGVVTKTAWAGAAYNLLLYMLASHVLGASWYFLSIKRHATCWKSECRNESLPVKCVLKYLGCSNLKNDDRMKWVNTTSVFVNCNPNSNSFNYGIFGNAVGNDVLSSAFTEKYLYCLWWGLQNLSSYGQGLTTSTFVWENAFAILIAILGLVLFTHLIGNMQTYLQSITVRLEEWRLKRRDTEEWMKHRQLPQYLRERVRSFVQFKWLATRGVDEETILRCLPTDLRRDIQRHLCLGLVRRVPFFSQMDDQLLDAICERLVSSLSTQGTYIVREGDPVTEMLFINRGRLESSTTNGGRTGFFNSITLRPGDFCGEELLAWALLPKSTLNLPSSTRTVRSLEEVEAFALRAEDLKFVANQFRRLHSKKSQHTFHFYSCHWRTWAACFIQAAWRRYKKRVLAKSLSLRESQSFNHDKVMGQMEHEEEEHNAVTSNTAQVKQNLGFTILASIFPVNTRRGVKKVKDVEMPKLQKPEEPDFSVEADDDDDDD